MTVDKELLDLIVCPKCKERLELLEQDRGLLCEKCQLVYPVTDGIPVMLVDEARPADGAGQ